MSHQASVARLLFRMLPELLFTPCHVSKGVVSVWSAGRARATKLTVNNASTVTSAIIVDRHIAIVDRHIDIVDRHIDIVTSTSSHSATSRATVDY